MLLYNNKVNITLLTYCVVISIIGFFLIISLNVFQGILFITLYLIITGLLALSFFRSTELGVLCLVLSVSVGGWLAAQTPGHNTNLEVAFVLIAIAGFTANALISRKKIILSRSVWFLLLFSIVAVISGLAAYWRFISFEPLPGLGYLNISVNVLGISSDSVMGNVVFSVLNYFSWGAVMLIALNVKWTREFTSSLKRVLLLAFAANCVVVIIQTFFIPEAFSSAVARIQGQSPGLMSHFNALGHSSAIVLAFLPWLPGKKQNKIINISLAVTLLLCLFFSGVRSAWLFVILSYIVYVFMTYFNKKSKLKFALYVLATAVIILIIFSILFFTLHDVLQNIPLTKRLFEGFDEFLTLGRTEAIFNKRFQMWGYSLGMIVAHPVAGVGCGTFFSEVGNYSVRIGLPTIVIDNALNFYLHIAAELGIVGLTLVILAFATLLLRKKEPPDVAGSADRKRFGRMAVPFICFLPILFFGPHLNETEVMLFFWLFAGAFVVRRSGEEKVPEEEQALSGRTVIAWAVVIALFAAAAVWSTLSLHPSRAWEELRWDIKAGFYEREAGNPPFAWTGPVAVRSVTPDRRFLHIQWRAGDEQAPGYTPRVKLWLGGVLLEERTFNDSEWHHEFYLVDSSEPLPRKLVIQTDPPFVPDRYAHSGDLRELGVAVAEIGFLDELAEESVGFWDWEEGRDFDFQWSKSESFRRVPLTEGRFKLFIHAGHPDVTEKPVVARFDLNRSWEWTLTLKDNDWHEVVIDPSELPASAYPDWHENVKTGLTGILRVQVDRTWIPSRTMQIEDHRRLGVAVSKVVALEESR